MVVDDGSTDDTFAALDAAFDLRPVPREVPADVHTSGALIDVHVSATYPLVVVRKENGGRSDSLNMGVNVARYPLVCFVDADSLLDTDALLLVSKPFADDPARVVATGGVVRAVNDCTVASGRVVDVQMPNSWLPRIQAVEYLRAFLMGRTGWSRLGALAIISGAFGMFRRDVVVARRRPRRDQPRRGLRPGHPDPPAHAAGPQGLPRRVRARARRLDGGAADPQRAGPPAPPLAPRAGPDAVAAPGHDRQPALRPDRAGHAALLRASSSSSHR